MACCASSQSGASPARSPVDRRRLGPILFEYHGSTPLTTFGRATGIRYHFPGPGARARVDPRDAPTLEIIRGLKIVHDAAPAGLARGQATS